MIKPIINSIINSIENALKAKADSKGNSFRDNLSDPLNRKHGTIEMYQKVLATELANELNSILKLNNNFSDLTEQPIFQKMPPNATTSNKWGRVRDSADIWADLGKYEMIVEIDATRADQVAKKMLSRFCYSSLINKPIIYVALLYQGTKSMNPEECKKYFQMGYEVLKDINPENVLIGYIIEKKDDEDSVFVCPNPSLNNGQSPVSIQFNDDKAFDSDLYRKYLEDNGVTSIECYMQPLNKVHSNNVKPTKWQKILSKYKKSDDINDYLKNNKIITNDLNKNAKAYWRKYCEYLKWQKDNGNPLGI